MKNYEIDAIIESLDNRDNDMEIIYESFAGKLFKKAAGKIKDKISDAYMKNNTSAGQHINTNSKEADKSSILDERKQALNIFKSELNKYLNLKKNFDFENNIEEEIIDSGEKYELNYIIGTLDKHGCEQLDNVDVKAFHKSLSEAEKKFEYHEFDWSPQADDTWYALYQKGTVTVK